LQQVHDDKKLHTHLVTNGIIWHFVSSAPNFGQVWKAVVKLKKVQLRNTALTFEGFSTILCQIKVSFTSKPICVKFTDIEDIYVLTPDHFLPIDRFGALIEPTTEDFPMNGLGGWQLFTRL
jgi:hypothetical protein